MNKYQVAKEAVKHKHQFRFSHQAIEPRGEQGKYTTIHDVNYIICPDCGELREQIIIPRTTSGEEK